MCIGMCHGHVKVAVSVHLTVDGTRSAAGFETCPIHGAVHNQIPVHMSMARAGGLARPRLEEFRIVSRVFRSYLLACSRLPRDGLSGAQLCEEWATRPESTGEGPKQGGEP